MSCPDWRALARRHEADPSAAPEWSSALRHLDRCPACQVAAPAVEPTLLFRRLPSLEAGRDEIEATKQAVAGMRRAQTIERRSSPLKASWLQVAALAAVLMGSLLLRGAGEPSGGAAPPAESAAAGIDRKAAAASDDSLRRLPLIETTDPTYGSIIQVVDDDISLVLVVPSEADV